MCCPDAWPRDLWSFAVLIIGLIPVRSNESEAVSHMKVCQAFKTGWMEYDSG
jgi:hypothetical protein